MQLEARRLMSQCRFLRFHMSGSLFAVHSWHTGKLVYDKQQICMFTQNIRKSCQALTASDTSKCCCCCYEGVIGAPTTIVVVAECRSKCTKSILGFAMIWSYLLMAELLERIPRRPPEGLSERFLGRSSARLPKEIPGRLPWKTSGWSPLETSGRSP